MENKGKWIVVSITLGMAALLTGAVITAEALSTGMQPQPRAVAHTMPVGVAASTPLSTGFTYQGELKDGGEPVNGDCGMAFRLYDQATNGNQVGTAISTTVPISDGLFTVNLDFGSDAFTGEARWLAIRVLCPEDSVYADLGRQELTASPYALYAGSAGALQGNSVTTTVPAAGEVLEWDGSAWGPATDDDTTYSAGAGLDLSDTQFSVVTSTMQQRVSGVCSAGSSIRVIDSDGSVACEADDDTTYTNGMGLDLSDNEFSITTTYRLPQECSGGQIAEWNGSAWQCGDDAGAGGPGDITAVFSGDGLTGGGVTGDVTVTVHFSGTGSAATVARSDHDHDDSYYTETELQGDGSADVHWNNLSSVPTGLEDGDDDTTYTAGAGLALSGTQFSVVTSTIQQRVTGACGSGYAIRQVNADGTVVCEADDDTTTFWSLTGNSGTNPAKHFVGTTDEVSLTLAVSGTGALRLEPNATSPNLIGGYTGNRVAPGVVGGAIGGGGIDGQINQVAGNYGTVGGGRGNTAGGYADTVGGGRDNAVSGGDAVVGGGSGNTASNQGATIGGGTDNTASSEFATVGGGEGNAASEWYATVGGGGWNTAGNWHATVAGGYDNTASGWYATVGGGSENTASDDYTTIGGGETVSVTGQAATVAGGSRITVTGNYAAVGGGRYNTVNASGATVGGGQYNTASGSYATVGGGQHNTATSFATTVGGGSENTASWSYSTVGGGRENFANDDQTTIGGGRDNEASGNSATVGGGLDNTASGLAATVPGGRRNTAGGDYSLAAGRRAKAYNDGCFVWGDATDADVPCYNDNRWVARASGGVYFYTNAVLTSGVYLSAGGSGWNAVSDRQRKENLAPVDTQALLVRLAEIPISTWNYRSQDPSVRHIGPMAQDFNALLDDLGGEGEAYINTLDADGVALAAIQGLYAQTRALETENAAQQEQIDALQQQNGDLEARVAALEAASSNGPAPSQASQSLLPWAIALLAGAGLAWASRRRGVQASFAGGGR